MNPGSLSPKMEHNQRIRSPLASPSAPRRAQNAQSLRLPPLPRFHPANFPSQHSSTANTPASGINSPQPPLSPRTQSRQYSDAQRHLYMYQRELLATMGRGPASAKPDSPRLAPAGSPGPVTPLALEEAGGYLVAGASSPGLNETSHQELVEKLIREETTRAGDAVARLSDHMSSTVGGR